MRVLALLSLLGLSAMPAMALAQDASPPPPPGADMPPPPPQGGWMKPPHGGWMHNGDTHHGWDHDPAEMLTKFYNANTTHDGHLTLAQAKAADMKPVVEHFADIDVAHHGYVTFNDIMAWHLDDMAKHLEAQADKLRAKD